MLHGRKQDQNPAFGAIIGSFIKMLTQQRSDNPFCLAFPQLLFDSGRFVFGREVTDLSPQYGGADQGEGAAVGSGREGIVYKSPWGWPLHGGCGHPTELELQLG